MLDSGLTALMAFCSLGEETNRAVRRKVRSSSLAGAGVHWVFVVYYGCRYP